MTVTTKSNDDLQYIWESAADASFTISEDKEGEPLGRGSMVTLTLKEDAQEFLDESKLKEVVTKYSEFINYPIYLWTSYEEEVEVAIEDEEGDDEEEKADEEEKQEKQGEDGEDEFDFEEEDEAPTTKKVKETRWKWTLLNEQKAIWTRDPSEVEEDEYNKFYQSIAKDTKDPLTYTHFKAEVNSSPQAGRAAPHRVDKIRPTHLLTGDPQMTMSCALCSHVVVAEHGWLVRRERSNSAPSFTSPARLRSTCSITTTRSQPRSRCTSAACSSPTSSRT